MFEILLFLSQLSLALNRFDMEAGDSADAMDALSFTARLPFVAGASKTVVLIGCNACRDGAVRYGDIQRILLNNDIHLHVLVQDTIRLKSKSPKTAYIYGMLACHFTVQICNAAVARLYARSINVRLVFTGCRYNLASA